MEHPLTLDNIINGIKQSDSREQIQHYCNQFCQHVDFKHFMLFGSIFTSMVAPPSYVIASPDKTFRNKKRQLEAIVLSCKDTFTPVITGNIDPQSFLSNSLFRTYSVSAAKQLSISFPVHFPAGKFAVLHLATPIKKQDIENKVLSSLAFGNLFAHEAGKSILHFLENELENKPPYLNQREKECLLLASDGKAPSQIGRQVGLSAHTVTFHLKKAREKLHSKNIQGAVSKAMLRGDVRTQISSGKA